MPLQNFGKYSLFFFSSSMGIIRQWPDLNAPQYILSIALWDNDLVLLALDLIIPSVLCSARQCIEKEFFRSFRCFSLFFFFPLIFGSVFQHFRIMILLHNWHLFLCRKERSQLQNKEIELKKAAVKGCNGFLIFYQKTLIRTLK